MKKYRSEAREIVRGWRQFKDTKMIVWIGSSKYWSKVYLNTEDHRLYIRTGYEQYEALDTFNIRETGSLLG